MPRIEIDVPVLPHPGGTSQANHYREAADRLEHGYEAGGSTMKDAVAVILRQVAAGLNNDAHGDEKCADYGDDAWTQDWETVADVLAGALGSAAKVIVELDPHVKKTGWDGGLAMKQYHDAKRGQFA